jgi:hypothetical protein
VTDGRAAPDGRPTFARRRLITLAALAALPAACGSGPSEQAVPPSPGPSGSTGHAESVPSGGPGGGVTASIPPAVTSGGGPVPFRRGRAMLGAYLDLGGLSLAGAVALRRRQLGREQRILHGFYAWTDDLPRSAPALADGSTLMVSWRGTAYDTITSGSADKLIAAAARRLAQHRRPVLLRWGWEMNGDWYRWGGADNNRDTGGYIASWRRLHRIFGEEGADNVSWVWSPNWNSSPDAAWNAMGRYYPGDSYVDWVGVSGYDLDGEAPEDLFGGIYAAYASRKPILISEVGAVNRGGRTKADWITRFAAWVQAHPAVGAVVWFDTDTHPGSAERWRIDTDDTSLAAFRTMARSARFSG